MSGIEPPASEEKLHAFLARRVRLARAQRGMTRKQLAQQSGISLAYLARVEGGTGNLSLSLLFRLAVALNLSIEKLLAPDETQNADLLLIVEFLKRQTPEKLARIRRRLFQEFEDKPQGPPGRIALLGIRGVGKSTLGPLLAERLGAPFVELNREIEREASLSLNEIIMLYGQRGYRQMEHRCLERILLTHPKVVVATGGGIVTVPKTYELLLSSFFTIWLKATPKVMFSRVMAQNDARIAQPQLRTEAMENIERLLETREPLYSVADKTFDTSGKTVEQSVRGLLALLPSGVRASPLKSVAKRARTG